MNLQTKPQMSIILTGEKYKKLKVIRYKRDANAFSFQNNGGCYHRSTI